MSFTVTGIWKQGTGVIRDEEFSLVLKTREKYPGYNVICLMIEIEEWGASESLKQEMEHLRAPYTEAVIHTQRMDDT